MLGSEKDRQESSLGPCFLSSCQIKQVTLRLENTVQKIAGVYGSSLTILDGVGINLFDSIFFFFSFFFFLQMGYFVSTSVIFTSVSQQKCLFLYLGAEAFCRR